VLPFNRCLITCFVEVLLQSIITFQNKKVIKSFQTKNDYYCRYLVLWACFFAARQSGASVPIRLAPLGAFQDCRSLAQTLISFYKVAEYGRIERIQKNRMSIIQFERIFSAIVTRVVLGEVIDVLLLSL